MASSPSTPRSRPGSGRARTNLTRAAMRHARRSPCCGSNDGWRKREAMPESRKKPAKSQEGPKDKKANRRGAARLAAVQALYQMDIAGAGINDIFAEFESHWLGGEVEGDKYLPAEAAFFRDIVSGVVRDQAKLDPIITARRIASIRFKGQPRDSASS